MKRFYSCILLLFVALSLLIAQPVTELKEEANATVSFTDSSNRTVELPTNMTKIAPSGNVATMVFSCLAPEYMTVANSTPSTEQMKYLPQELLSVPPVGQLYGGKATLNLEEMMATGSQVMIDIGDYKNGIEADLDSFTAQTGIPAIFLAGDLESLASSFRKIGALLKDKEERAEEIASFIDETISMAKVNSAKVKEEEKVTIMFSSSTDGLGTNAKGSSQAQVIDFIGAINAIEVEKVSAKGGGNQINMEQLYNFNPDIILFAEDTVYDTVSSDPAWAELDAIKKGLYYEIPSNPYCWMGTPPSLNMVLGIWWLGNLVYPQYYDYDMVEVTKKAYKVFWGYDMTSEEAMSILSNSTLKTR